MRLLAPCEETHLDENCDFKISPDPQQAPDLFGQEVHKTSEILRPSWYTAFWDDPALSVSTKLYGPNGGKLLYERL